MSEGIRNEDIYNDMPLKYQCKSNSEAVAIDSMRFSRKDIQKGIGDIKKCDIENYKNHSTHYISNQKHRKKWKDHSLSNSIDISDLNRFQEMKLCEESTTKTIPQDTSLRHSHEHFNLPKKDKGFQFNFDKRDNDYCMRTAARIISTQMELECDGHMQAYLDFTAYAADKILYDNAAKLPHFAENRKYGLPNMK